MKKTLVSRNHPPKIPNEAQTEEKLEEKIVKNRDQVFIFAEKNKAWPLFFLIDFFAFIYFIDDSFKPMWSKNGRKQTKQRGRWEWQKASHTH